MKIFKSSFTSLRVSLACSAAALILNLAACSNENSGLMKNAQLTAVANTADVAKKTADTLKVRVKEAQVAVTKAKNDLATAAGDGIRAAQKALADANDTLTNAKNDSAAADTAYKKIYSKYQVAAINAVTITYLTNNDGVITRKSADLKNLAAADSWLVNIGENPGIIRIPSKEVPNYKDNSGKTVKAYTLGVFNADSCDKIKMCYVTSASDKKFDEKYPASYPVSTLSIDMTMKNNKRRLVIYNVNIGFDEDGNSYINYASSALSRRALVFDGLGVVKKVTSARLRQSSGQNYRYIDITDLVNSWIDRDTNTIVIPHKQTISGYNVTYEVDPEIFSEWLNLNANNLQIKQKTKDEADDTIVSVPSVSAEVKSWFTDANYPFLEDVTIETTEQDDLNLKASMTRSLKPLDHPEDLVWDGKFSGTARIATIGALPKKARDILLGYKCGAVKGYANMQGSFSVDQEVDELDSCGLSTPLCYAASNLDAGTVFALIIAGAEVKKTCDFDRTPLDMALGSAGSTDADGTLVSIVSSLINAGASVLAHNSLNRWTPLHYAAYSGVPLAVWKILLPLNADNRRIDIDFPVSDKNLGSPRSWAKGKLTVYPHYQEVVDYLLQYDNQDPNP